MLRYYLYFWTPPVLTAAQEIEAGRSIVMEGREKFLKRTAPFNDAMRVLPRDFGPGRWIAIAIFAALMIPTLIAFWLPIFIGVAIIGSYSGGTLALSRYYHRRWADQMIAKYAAHAAANQENQKNAGSPSPQPKSQAETFLMSPEQHRQRAQQLRLQEKVEQDKAELALGEKALAYQVKNENMNPPLPKIYKIISPNEYEYDVELYPQEVESWVKEINSNSKNVPIVCVQDANGKIVWQKQINISEAAHKLAADQGERLAQAAINRNAAVIERPGTSPAQAKSPKAPDRGHRSELLASWNHRLQLCGRAVAKAWLVLAGLILLFGFQVSGIAASFLIGFVAARIIGGALGIIAFFTSAFLFGLFLAIYVWEPHVKALMYRAVDALNDALGRI